MMADTENKIRELAELRGVPLEPAQVALLALEMSRRLGDARRRQLEADLAEIVERFGPEAAADLPRPDESATFGPIRDAHALAAGVRLGLFAVAERAADDPTVAALPVHEAIMAAVDGLLREAA